MWETPDEVPRELIQQINQLESGAIGSHIIDRILQRARDEGIPEDKLPNYMRMMIRGGVRKHIMMRLKEDPTMPWTQPDWFDELLELARLDVDEE